MIDASEESRRTFYNIRQHPGTFPKTRRNAHPTPTLKFYDAKKLLESKKQDPPALMFHDVLNEPDVADVADEAGTTEDVAEGTRIPNDAPQRSAQFCTEQGDEEINMTSEALLDVLSETPRPRNLTTTAVDPA